MKQRKPPASYNYERFDPDRFDVSVPLSGPSAGETMPDFSLRTADGRSVELSDYRGTWVVLETGSLTCPMYARNVDAYDALRDEFPDVEFLLLYVREAHPGERVGPHETEDEKVKRARQLRDEYDEDREILVDDVDGSVHRSLGSMPNMVYVIDPSGRVVYRCNWADIDRIRDVLAHREQIHSEEHIDPSMWNPLQGIRVLLKGGWQAVWDFVTSIPSLVRLHRRLSREYHQRRQDVADTHPKGED